MVRHPSCELCVVNIGLAKLYSTSNLMNSGEEDI